MVAQAGAPAEAAKPEIPPAAIDDVAHTVGNLMHLPPAATGGNIQRQVQAANTLIRLANTVKKEVDPRCFKRD
jgi:hypothetical protein